MLIAWMAYALVFTILAWIAGRAAERVAGIWGAPRRFLWLVTLVVSAIAPVVLGLKTPPVATPTVDASGAAIGESATFTWVHGTPNTIVSPALARARDIIASLDTYAWVVWSVSSVFALAAVIAAMVRLARCRSRWQEIDLDGERVFLSPDAGPAVVGVLRPAIVVPRWALSLDANARGLMLRHEAEHIAARDPYLLALGVFALIAFPWNAALWMIVRRLRLAIEVDCDARVVRASARVREYGLLLLAVGARRSSVVPFAAALAARRPLLERRLSAMTASRPRSPRALSVGMVFVVVAATTAASRAPRPAPLVRLPTPVASSSVVLTREVAPTVAPSTQDAELSAPARPPRAKARRAPVATTMSLPAEKQGRSELPFSVIRAMVAAHHPSALEGDTTISTVAIVLDAGDQYVQSWAGILPPADSTAANDASPMRRGLASIDRNAINSVEVMKYRAGVIRAAPLSVILISLK
jgi:beta-lactamase regulating signal transducer with metallopeptidase domain